MKAFPRTHLGCPAYTHTYRQTDIQEGIYLDWARMLAVGLGVRKGKQETFVRSFLRSPKSVEKGAGDEWKGMTRPAGSSHGPKGEGEAAS